MILIRLKAEDAKFRRMINVARKLPATYKPSSAYSVGGELLVNWQKQTDLLLKKFRIYGFSLYGSGATIMTTTYDQCFCFRCSQLFRHDGHWMCLVALVI